MKVYKCANCGGEITYCRTWPDMRVKCEQCEAISINGVARHETGCPNARHECKGCNELIPVGQRYYADCQ